MLVKHKTPGYLEGDLLIATTRIADSCFARSVVFMFSHGPEGAMGIIINQVIEELDIVSILQGLDIEIQGRPQLPVHFGGPVDSARGFVLHTSDYNNDGSIIFADSGFAVTSDDRIFVDYFAGKGPKSMLLALGYAGWEAGQLEAEIENNSWISVPATPGLVFATPETEKWQAAARSCGVDMFKLSSDSGHA